VTTDSHESAPWLCKDDDQKVTERLRLQTRDVRDEQARGGTAPRKKKQNERTPLNEPVAYHGRACKRRPRSTSPRVPRRAHRGPPGAGGSSMHPRDVAAGNH